MRRSRPQLGSWPWQVDRSAWLVSRDADALRSGARAVAFPTGWDSARAQLRQASARRLTSSPYFFFFVAGFADAGEIFSVAATSDSGRSFTSTLKPIFGA